MPISEARRRLPAGRYLAPDMEKYSAASRRLFAILDEFTPFVEPLSIDEAFLDLAGLRLHYASPYDVAVAMRRRIREELALPASVGIAAVKFLAKMASKQAKPDGLMLIEEGTELAFLDRMGVAELWGVGDVTLRTLAGLGIETVGQLREYPAQSLQRHVGNAAAAHLVALAHGEDPRQVDRHRDAKSVSVESTFAADISGADAVERALLALCHRLAGRLRRARAAGRTVNLKVRFGDFTTVTRSVTCQQLVADTAEIWPVASELFAKVDSAGRGIRLLGVGVTGLAVEEATQLMLDGSDRAALAEVKAEVKERFGDDAVLPARLADRSGPDANG